MEIPETSRSSDSRNPSSRRSPALGYEEPTPVQRDDDPPDPRRPRPARAGRDGHRQDGGLRAADDPAARRRGRAGAGGRARRVRAGSCSCRRASSPCRSPKPSTSTRAAPASPSCPVYGGALDDAADPRARARRRHRRRHAGRVLDHIRRGSLTLDAIRVLVLDEADEMLDMGFAEDIDAILEAHAEGAADHAVLGDDAAAAAGDCRAAPATIPQRITIAREKTAAGKIPRVRQVAYIVAARAQGGGAAARARHGEPGVGARLLPHAARSRHARRDAERARLPRGGASRRHAAAAAGGRDGALPRRRRPTCSIATDVAARGLDIQQLSHVFNYDVPVGARSLRPPHRTHRPRRARRRRDHAGRAARASAAAQHRVGSPSRRSRSRPFPTVADLRARGSSSRARRCASARGRRPRRRARRGRVAGEGTSTSSDVAAAAVKLVHAAATARGRADEQEDRRAGRAAAARRSAGRERVRGRRVRTAPPRVREA